MAEEEGFVDYEVWQKAKGNWSWESPSVDRPCNPTLQLTVGLGALMRQLQASPAFPHVMAPGGRGHKGGSPATRARSTGVTTSLSAVLAMTQPHQPKVATKPQGTTEREWTDGRTGNLALARLPSGVLLNGRFRPVRIIGEGTFAQLLDAIDEWRTPPSSYSATTDGKLHVAIKIMKAPFDDPESLHVHSSIGIQEATWIRQLNRVDVNDMSHMIRLHSTFYFSGHFCLVLELLGEPLSSVPPPHPLCFLSPAITAPSSSSSSASSPSSSPSSRRPLATATRTFSLPEIRSIAVQLLTSLSFLRNRGILHADVKPENIALVPPPTAMCRGFSAHDHSANYFPIHTLPNIKLIDFGNAIPLTLNSEYTKVQSLPYRAPEVLWGEPYDTAIDMWSVGCVLFELATGNLLFPLSDARKRFVNHDNKAGQEDLEPSLMTEMTALLGGEAEALCDSWTPSERKRKGREWRAKRHRRKRKGDEGRGLDSSSLSPPADGGRRGRHRHTKVLFWDETVGGDYHREGRMTNISLTTTSGSSDMDMDASSDDSSTETTATDVAMQDSAEDCTRVFLAYKKGERMHIFGRKGESYWRCWLRGKEGLVPVAHLRLLTPFRCVSAEDSESEEEREETEEESKGGGYAASELKWMRAKERERAIRHKQVDITLRQLVKLLRINDFIFADFLMQFLIYDPKRRYTPQEALLHRFLVPFFPFKGVFPELNDATKLVPSTEALREEAAELAAVKGELDELERTESRLSPSKLRQRTCDPHQERMSIDASSTLRTELANERREIEAQRNQVNQDQARLDSAQKAITMEQERQREENERLQSINESESRRVAEAMSALERERQDVQEQLTRLAQERESLAQERARADIRWSAIKEREESLALLKNQIEAGERENNDERGRLIKVKAKLEQAKAAFDEEVHDKRDRLQTGFEEVEHAHAQVEVNRKRLEAEQSQLAEEREKLSKERMGVSHAWTVVKEKEARLAELQNEAEREAKANDDERARLAQLQAELEHSRMLLEQELRAERERLKADGEEAKQIRTQLEAEAERVAQQKSEATQLAKAANDAQAQLAEAQSRLEQERISFSEEQRAERDRLRTEREELALAQSALEDERRSVAAESARVSHEAERLAKQQAETEEAQRTFKIVEMRAAKMMSEAEKVRRENEDERERLAKLKEELEQSRTAFDQEQRERTEAEVAAAELRKKEIDDKIQRMMVTQMRDLEQHQHDVQELARDRAELEAARQRHSDEVVQWKATQARRRQHQPQQNAGGDGQASLTLQHEGQTSSPLSPSSPWSSPSPALIHRQLGSTGHQSSRHSPLAALVTPSGRFVPVGSASTLRPTSSQAAATRSSPSASPVPSLTVRRLSSATPVPTSKQTAPAVGSDGDEDEDDILLIKGAEQASAKQRGRAPKGTAKAAPRKKRRREEEEDEDGRSGGEDSVDPEGDSGDGGSSSQYAEMTKSSRPGRKPAPRRRQQSRPPPTH